VLAVIPLFSSRFHQFIYRWRETATLDYLLKIMLAFFITGVGGLILDRRHFKLPEELMPVAWALLTGGILFWGRNAITGEETGWASDLDNCRGCGWGS